MAKARRSKQATEDISEIWHYIALDNPAAADRLLDRIEAASESQADLPHAGTLREDLLPELRSFPVGNYIVYYFPTTEGIVVARVLHASRDHRTIFERYRNRQDFG